MKVIYLESNFNNDMINIGIYFKNMEDCNKYLHVFKDHWCNVPWKKPIEKDVNDLSPFEKSKMDKFLIQDPIKSAEDNLSWGFHNCDYAFIGLADDQKSTVQSLVSKLSEEE